jgi:apolipoprotein N-acyltransferase
LAAAARDTHSTIVVGAVSRDPARDMAIAFLPDGRRINYDKRHRLLPLEAAYTPGHAPGLLGHGRAMAICKDMDFPRTLRSDAQKGDIRIIAVPAGDFGMDRWIHGRMAIMRGVENGFAVLRAAFNGLETVSDAQGRVIARARIDRMGALVVTVADVALGPGATLYTKIGDVFPWACLLLSAGLLGWMVRKLRVPV